MRIVILIGGVVGGIIAVLLAGNKDELANTEPKTMLDKARRHVREAIQAGQEAADEKEVELRQEFEKAKEGR
jgi:gas vesicle protein